jgi:hyperosmotically inducible protein
MIAFTKWTKSINRPKLLKLVISLVIFFGIGLAYADNVLKELELDLRDSVITTKIKAKFTNNDNLNPLKISVSTHNGVVSLVGHVKNKQAFVDALRLVKTTKGVKAINDERLIIKDVNTAFTDAYITAKVEAAILRAKVLNDESIPLVGINAKTSNGIVTLSGHVKRKKSIDAIIRQVTLVHGVNRLIINLKCKDVGINSPVIK